MHPEQNEKNLNFQLKSIWDIKWLGNETEMLIHIVEKNWFSSTFKSFVTFHNYLFPCLIDEMIKKVFEIEKNGINLNPVLKYTNEKRFECIICPEVYPCSLIMRFYSIAKTIILSLVKIQLLKNWLCLFSRVIILFKRDLVRLSV